MPARFQAKLYIEDCKHRAEILHEVVLDLRGLKKEVTFAGDIRFIGETDDSYCDRTWAKALRQHAANYREEVWALACD